MRIVLAVGRDGTLLRAGKTLGVAHSTVGRRVNALEQHLGVQLFARTPEGFIPTGSGQDLISVAEGMEEEVLGLEGRIRGRDAQLQGPLRVSTGDAFFYGFEDAFSAFTKRYPKIDLTITTTSEQVSLTRREADAVLRLSDSPPETLVGRKVGYVQFAVYASPSLVERVGAGSPLSAYPWLGWDRRENRRWFDAWLAKQAPGAKIVLRMDNHTLLRAHAVRRGMGVQILPCFVGDPDVDLVRIAPLDPLFRLDLWLLTLPELRTNSRVRAFLDHMAEALGQHKAALAGDEP